MGFINLKPWKVVEAAMNGKGKQLKNWIVWLPAVFATILFLAAAIFRSNAESKTEYRIVCLGDSILGNVRDETSVTSVMESILEEPVANGAFGGTCASLSNTMHRPTFYEDSLNLAGLADAIAYEDFKVQFYDISSNQFGLSYFEEALKELAQVDFTKTELVFIEHGINDFSAGRPLDNEEDPMDRYTYGGALRYSIEKLQEYYPQLRIVLVTPLYCYFQENGQRALDSETSDFGYGSLENYVELELAIAKEYGLDVIDNFHNMGINRENVDEYTEDGIHLNQKGRQLLAETLANYVITH